MKDMAENLSPLSLVPIHSYEPSLSGSTLMNSKIVVLMCLFKSSFPFLYQITGEVEWHTIATLLLFIEM